VTCNIAGIAGLSMPCGFTSGDKPLPIGMQLLGNTFEEQKLLRIARMYEMATEWHKKRPKVE
jgi:aspartyl-tRNA(Asn)/glutamyl-tRNA(Gln) amidotransferase subunit A